MKKFAIIVAGGGGTRMKSKIPKQYLPLAGKPILMHTIDAFTKCLPDITIILVLPKSSEAMWHELCEKHSFSYPITIVHGGESRFQSVKNGLESIADRQSLVAIHDGVRPLISVKIIAESFRLAELHGNAIASVALKESLVLFTPEKYESVDRSKYRLIQTPQTFKTELIKKAYQKTKESPVLTDDASVAEGQNITITLFEGSYKNIKVTTPEDLIIAEALMKSL